MITVKLESPADKLLTQADNALFNVSGDGLAMIEYSGVHSDRTLATMQTLTPIIRM